MIKAYVFEGTWLVDRLALSQPMHDVRLAVKKEVHPSLMSEKDEVPEPCWEHKSYPCLFRSPGNKVMVYGKEDPVDFMERALERSPFSQNRQFLFAPYRVEAKLTYDNRETLEQLIVEAIRMGRKYKDERADGVIAEKIARDIDCYFRNGL